MKIAISTAGNSLKDQIDTRFGRCPNYLIVELEDGEVKSEKIIENTAAMQGGGAGIKAAQIVAEKEVDAVITGNVGPNAYQTLSQLNVKIYQASGTAEDALQKLDKGELQEPGNATAPSKAGMSTPEKKGKRILFPVQENNGMDSTVSQHFGHAPFFALYDTEKKKLEIIENVLDHNNPASTPVDQIMVHKPDIVYTLGIGQKAISLFGEKNVEVKKGNFATVTEALENIESWEDFESGCQH